MALGAERFALWSQPGRWWTSRLQLLIYGLSTPKDMLCRHSLTNVSHRPRDVACHLPGWADGFLPSPGQWPHFLPWPWAFLGWGTNRAFPAVTGWEGELGGASGVGREAQGVSGLGATSGSQEPPLCTLPGGQNEGLQGCSWVGPAPPASPFLITVLSPG